MERRFVFNEVAELYEAARPGYPEALFEDCIAAAALARGERVLDVGSGTGKGAAGFAKRGFPVLLVEPGADMIAVARKALSQYANVSFAQTTLEAWPVEPEAFGLVTSAQAWHWVDPAVSFTKAAAALRRGGVLAVFGHVPLRVPAALDQRFAQIYTRYQPQSSYSVPGATVAYLPGGFMGAMVEASPLFETVQHKAYAWRWPQTAQSYVDYQLTLSEFRLMSEETREAFLSEVASAIEAHGGRFDMEFETHLYLAKRKD